MSPDLAARRVIMSAYLYYRRASPVVSDPEYEDLVRLTLRGWGSLSACRQWQLESPEALAATGFHSKITTQAEAAAIAWHRAELGQDPQGYPINISEWRDHPDFGRWAPAEV